MPRNQHPIPTHLPTPTVVRRIGRVFSRGLEVCQFVCLSVFHTISQKPIHLDHQTWHKHVPPWKPIYLGGQKVKGQGHKAQKHCLRGTCRSCMSARFFEFFFDFTIKSGWTKSPGGMGLWLFCVTSFSISRSSLPELLGFRPTLRQSWPNKAGLKYPSVRPSVRPLFDLNKMLHVGRGRWVMHEGMQYDPIQGHGQGHEPLKFGNPAIFKSYLFLHLQWELAIDHWFLN